MKGSYQMKKMKKVCAVLCAVLSVLLLTSAFAGGDNAVRSVRWNQIVGVITALNVNNPVGSISAGTFPWSAGSGHANVDLSTGQTSFQVEGLVINGTVFSGTPGPITAVEGTLVCDAGSDAQTNLDTASVPLDAQGDAHFTGTIANIPKQCDNPIFLIRIAQPVGAAGLWIATGADRTGGLTK
jgi:hypothetical protein